jgi:hypothetical protein
MKTIVQLVSELKDYFLEKDKAVKQAVESNIAPVEADASSASNAYAVGKQLILNDVLYDVTSPISVGDAIDVGTNIAAANDLSTQIGGKQNQIEVTSMPTASASNVGKVLIYIGATTSTYTSGQSYQSTLKDGSYIWKPIPTAATVSYDGTQSGSSETNAQGAIDDLYSKNQTLETTLGNKVNTSDIANNLTTTTTGKVLDATQGKILNDDITNKHKLTRKTVNTSSWTADSTSQSGTTLYKKSISLSHVYVDSPSVDISTSTGSGLPTTAQQEAYDLLQYATVDGTTMYLYASAIPSTTFYIGIEGVD